MTCRCCSLSPFLYWKHHRHSVFMSDSSFYKGASTGMSTSQRQTATHMAYEAKTGRSLGTVYGISDAADKQAANRPYRRVGT